MKVFIDKGINIFTGREAWKRLKKKNDLGYLKGNQIAKVSSSRWKEAQECERKHWMRKEKVSTFNDRNDYYFDSFEKFDFLTTRKFNSVLEIGCGPFTNLRLISTKFKIRSCYLLDPLIHEYLSLPNCSYDSSYLYVDRASFVTNKLKYYLPNVWKHLKKVFLPKVKVAGIHSLPMEQYTSTTPMDMVVMINVIEHCYDIELVFKNILSCCKKGTVFVFSDKLYKEENIVRQVNNEYDSAHPLKVGRRKVLNYLSKNFSPLFQKTRVQQTFFKGNKVMWEDLFYVGIKI